MKIIELDYAIIPEPGNDSGYQTAFIKVPVWDDSYPVTQPFWCNRNMVSRLPWEVAILHEEFRFFPRVLCCRVVDPISSSWFACWYKLELTWDLFIKWLVLVLCTWGFAQERWGEAPSLKWLKKNPDYIPISKFPGDKKGVPVPQAKPLVWK